MAVADIMSSPFSRVLACFEYALVEGSRIRQTPGVLCPRWHCFASVEARRPSVREYRDKPTEVVFSGLRACGKAQGYDSQYYFQGTQLCRGQAAVLRWAGRAHAATRGGRVLGAGGAF